MRTILILFSLFFLHSTAIATQVIDDSVYPFHEPYLASLTSTLTAAPGFQTQTAELEFKPERRNVPLSEGRHRLRIHYKIHSSHAPLVFVIGGIGSTADSGSALFLASNMYEMGYSVVTLPNPFSWQFVIGGSRTGRVGFGPSDALDLYEFMKFTKRFLAAKKVNPKSYGLLGYSLGALYSGFIVKIDRDENAFQFKRVILFNPPLDMAHAISTLDGLYQTGNQLSEKRKSWIQGYILDFASRLPDMVKRGMNLIEICLSVKLKPRDLKWVIGDFFRADLRDVMLSGQQVEDTGIFNAPYTKYYRNARTLEAMEFSFLNYLERVFFPRSGRSDTLEETLRAGSFMTLLEIFKNDPAIFLFHNADDFLYQPELATQLDDAFGDRHLLFGHGGHIGNLWFPITQGAIRKIMTGL